MPYVESSRLSTYLIIKKKSEREKNMLTIIVGTNTKELTTFIQYKSYLKKENKQTNFTSFF